MEITEETRDGICILKPAGHIDSGTAAAFELRLLQAIGADPVRLVVDMGRIASLSPVGLRVLLVATRQARLAGGRIVLAAMPASLRALFNDSGFSGLFEIHATAEDALNSLR